MKRFLFLLVTKRAFPMACLFVLAGCANFQPTKSEVELTLKQSINATNQQNEGYALLYELVGKEMNVGKILIIKKDSPQLKTVIQKIAGSSKQIAEELERLAKYNPPLELKFTHLPILEQKTRELIEKEQGKGLLRTGGENFEFKLLLTQIEGMNYGAHLAAALRETETNLARRDFLQRTEKTLAALRDEIYQMILNRYAR